MRNLLFDLRGSSMAAGIRFSLFLILLPCIFSRPLSSAETSHKELEGQKIDQRIGRTVVVDPSRVIQIAWQPRVFLYRGFLSNEECDHLISWLHGKKKNSDPGADAGEINSEDEVVRRIDERVSAWTLIPKENGRPLQIVKLDGGESKQNNENFGKGFIKMPSEPLMATVVMHLSNTSRGGQILFPNSKNEALSDCASNSMTLNPTKGNAVVFFNAHLDGSPDNSSSHARCPLAGEDMWYAIKLFHLRAFRAKKDPPSLVLNANDCTDEDENCSSWAASGECKRNPVFMVGSPDYSGACRKSCNACGQY